MISTFEGGGGGGGKGGAFKLETASPGINQAIMFLDRAQIRSQMVEVLLYVHRNRSFIRDREPRTSTSTFTQLLRSEPLINGYKRI